MGNIKLLVCGSRTITDMYYVFNCIDSTIEYLRVFGCYIVAIIEGQAVGVDYLAGLFAKSHQLELMDDFKPKWNKYGKSAGFIRNKEMVDLCDKGMAIWDGKSKGTTHTISLLRKQNKLIRVYNYKK